MSPFLVHNFCYKLALAIGSIVAGLVVERGKVALALGNRSCPRGRIAVGLVVHRALQTAKWCWLLVTL